MRSMRNAAAVAVAVGLSATTVGAAEAAPAPGIERPTLSSGTPAAPAAAEEPKPLLAAADLKPTLYATHPLASKAGMTYTRGTKGKTYCHPGTWPNQGSPDYTDTDGDGFCPLGQTIRDLEATKDGRLIGTYGDGLANIDSDGTPAGRVAVVPLNLQNGQWETPFRANSEAMGEIRKLANGDLAISMLDPSRWTSTSGYLTNKGGQWHTVTSSILFTHVEDLAETASGDIWLFGSVQDAAIIARTRDGGGTWELMRRSVDPGNFSRYLAGSAVGGKVYTYGQIRTKSNGYAGPLPPIEYDGGKWPSSSWPGNQYFQGKIVQWKQNGYLEFFDGSSAFSSSRLPTLATQRDGTSRPRLHSANDGYLYATTGGMLVRTKTPDGPWEMVGEFSALQDKFHSLAVHNGRIYFGGEGGKIYRSALTVPQAIQESKNAQVKAKAELLKPLKTKLAAAEAEVTRGLSADKAEDAKKRDATIAAVDAVVAKRTAAAKNLARASSPPAWAALSSEYAAAAKEAAAVQAQVDATAKAQARYWDSRSRTRLGEIENNQNRPLNQMVLDLRPYEYRADGEPLLKASTDARTKAVKDAVAAGKASWTAQQTALNAKLTQVKKASDAATKAAATVQGLVDAEAKHRSEVAAAEAKRAEDTQSAAYAAFQGYMNRELIVSEKYAKRNPPPSVAGMKDYGDRMAQVAKRELARAETATKAEAAHADSVTTSERARANTDWAAMVRAALPGTSELEVAHRDALVKRVTADRAEQVKQIDADAAVRKSAVAAYGEVRQQWWSVQGESATLSNKWFDVWAKHDASRVAEIERVRKDEEARAARLKAGPPLSDAAKAAQRKRLQDRVNRLKASSRQVHIADDKAASDTYKSERKRIVDLYYAEYAQASKAGANKRAWEARAKTTLYDARDARLKVVTNQWKARIKANRYAQDAASNDLMRFAP